MPEQKRNTRLAVAIAEDGRPAYQIAAASGINATTFSGIVSGRVQAGPAVRSRIALALERDEGDLFEQVLA